MNNNDELMMMMTMCQWCERSWPSTLRGDHPARQTYRLVFRRPPSTSWTSRTRRWWTIW